MSIVFQMHFCRNSTEQESCCKCIDTLYLWIIIILILVIPSFWICTHQIQKPPVFIIGSQLLDCSHPPTDFYINWICRVLLPSDYFEVFYLQIQLTCLEVWIFLSAAPTICHVFKYFLPNTVFSTCFVIVNVRVYICQGTPEPLAAPLHFK